MEKWEFDAGCRRLKAVYGDKSFPDERLAIIWNRFTNLERDRWFEMIEALIGSQRYAPLLKEMETWLDENKVMWSTSERVGDCKICFGYGTYLETRNGYEYGFQCECPAGAMKANALPRNG